MHDFKYQLVLQLPGITQHDFDKLVNFEKTVASALHGSIHELDGHDFGSGTGNVFIDTNDPLHSFSVVRSFINISAYPALRAGYRSFNEDEYTLIWPENLEDEFNIM